MIEMVVFDMAGTTVNEDNLVYKTLCLAIQSGGYSTDLSEVIAIGAGKEKRSAIKDILSKYTEDTAEIEKSSEHIYRQFLRQLSGAYQQKPVSPGIGAEALFAALREKQIKVVLNTGYDRNTACQLLDRLGWEEQQEIDLLVTATEVTRGRPYPDMILYAMKKMEIVNPSKVAKIGDSVVDIEEGREAGCGLVVGITTGAHSREYLSNAKPDHIIDSLKELGDLLD